jgi:hypothetical protein
MQSKKGGGRTSFHDVGYTHLRMLALHDNKHIFTDGIFP